MNDEHVANNWMSPNEISRRRFLEAAGFTFSLATLGGCWRAPTETALPFVKQPEGVIPGRTMSYASTCGGCPASCGLLVSVRDGRPLKMEGMPDHPLSRGGLCAIGQALPLGLYDGHRLDGPLQNGGSADWKDVDKAIIEKLSSVSSQGAVRFVTPTVTSPTLQAAIDSFLAKFEDARHVMFDAVSSSAILDAHEQTHGSRVLPHYKLDQAQVIVSFGADFLGTWISPVEFTAAWQTNRVPTEKNPEMSHHVQFEGRMSLTGANADRRHRLAPDEYGIVLSHLADRIAKLAGTSSPQGSLGESPISDAELAQLAERLWNARGQSLVLSDSQVIADQLLVNFINQTLRNYGRTVDIDRPSWQRQSNDAEVIELIEELKAGKVSAVFVAGTDLTYNLPERESLADAIAKVPLVVSFSEREDEFASLAHFVCPDHHPLESWLDFEPVHGLVSLSQPTLKPLRNTRSILESLARWSGRNESAYEILRANWKKDILPRAKSVRSGDPARTKDMLPRAKRGGSGDPSPTKPGDPPTTETTTVPKTVSWDQALHTGFVEVAPKPVLSSQFKPDAVKLMADRLAKENYTLALYSKIGLTDSRHAHNPWLQELPDPISKMTWDNYVCVSPDVAKKLDLSDGDEVSVNTSDGDTSVELPALVQRGQHDRVVSIALGYGVKGTGRFADIGPQWLEAKPTVAKGELVGKNVADFIEARDAALQYTRQGVTLKKTGRRHELATTQRYNSLEVPARVAPHGAEVRGQIQRTTLPAFAKNPEAGKPEVHHFSDQQLWPEDHPKDGHWWGLAIDLNKCTGCSACLIACQSENNVPVVGKDEIHRQREMHWLRIDRYYMGEDDDVDVLHQPMMCQHCDNAPCETVCPVLATVHSEEGLNEQAYNRCVGTRYCANNCPYKVRRFNWFKYEHEDLFQNLALNPDVTVRSRGVMEKCSMCVQRIEAARIDARSRGESIADGAIQTACQQSCPAQAIVFGDMNNPDSRVRDELADPRRYRVLEEFNFRPSVAYLRVVRNRDGVSEEGEGGKHV